MYGRGPDETSGVVRTGAGPRRKPFGGGTMVWHNPRGNGPQRESARPGMAAAYRPSPGSWHDGIENQARRATMSTERMTINGIELEVLRRGAGTPVLLLHGMDTVHPQARFLDLSPGTPSWFRGFFVCRAGFKPCRWRLSEERKAERGRTLPCD